jgi:Ca2+-binding RTX toxin-like protein
MPFIKIDPSVASTTIDLSALGLRLGHVIEIKLVGDFSANNVVTHPWHPDTNQNTSFFYAGAKVSGQLTIGRSLSITAITSDRPLTDNSDPDNDYGALITFIQGPLFTPLRDVVNFRLLNSAQKDAVARGEVFYSAGGGNDTVVLPMTGGYELAPDVTWNPIRFFNAGAGSDTVTGGDGNDRVAGGSANDLLKGAAGSDTLWGQSGNDRLIGGSGHDRLNGHAGLDRLSGGDGDDGLVGGLGRDILAGGFGRDVFAFDDRHTGASQKTADYIVDLDGALGDRLDLSRVDANTSARGDQAFTFIGEKGAFTQAGQVRYQQTGTDTWLYLNTDADSAAEAVIRLKGSLDLSKAWFTL